MAVVVYNLLMLAVDAGVLLAVRRSPPRRRPATARLWILLAGLAAVALSVLLAGGFGTLRLLAYGLFLHFVLQLTALAVLWWRPRRRLALSALATAGLLSGIAADAFLVEPHWLEVTRIEIPTDKVDRSLRIAVIADLQTDVVGAYERRVLREVMTGRPDLILMPGDFLQEASTRRRKELQAELNRLLREVGFAASLGVFAVEGNADWPDWPSIFEGLPVTAVTSTTAYELPGLRLTALSLADSFSPTLRLGPAPGLHIVFGHGPDFALGRVEADLLVAGHTHGGQVRLPFIGPLITFSQVPRSWAAGITELSGGRHLVVSRGVGMERLEAPRLRFLCRPQLVFIDLKPLSVAASPAAE